MVKLSKIFPVLAIVAGLGSAFASRMPEVSKTDPVYEWTETGATQPDFTGTVTEAEQHYGCPGGQEICAEGELLSGMGSPTEFVNRQ